MITYKKVPARGSRSTSKLLLVVLTIGFCLSALAQQSGGQGADKGPNPALESQKLELERQKFTEATSAEKERIQIEWKKLEFEKSNASRTFWMSIAPLVVSLLTIALGIFTLSRQLKQQKETQQLAAALQFEIKAAEIAFAGKTPAAVKNRVSLLKKIFSNRLPKDFIAESFDPIQYGGKIESSESKKEFLELLAKYPGREKIICDVWKELFGEEWVESIRPLISPK